MPAAAKADEESCGGLTEAARGTAYLRDNGLLFFASGLTDPDLSFAASLQLLGAWDLPHPAAPSAPRHLSGSSLSTPITVEGDRAIVPAGPGLGGDVDSARLAELA